VTNIDRQIRRNRGYVLAAIAALVVVEALTWGLFNVVSGFLFPVDELSRKKYRVSGCIDAHFVAHFAHNNLEMLVMNNNSL